MKIIAIGDIHGQTVWEQIVAKEANADKFVFVGDYFDSRAGIPCFKQIENFKSILNFKTAHPDQVILLFGNHDLHYLPGIDQLYSGYQYSCAMDISQIIKEAIDNRLLQICYQEDNVVYSHAGFSKTWCYSVLGNDPVLTSFTRINDCLIYQPRCFKFTGLNHDNTGDSITQPLVWIRPKSLLENAIDGFTQVVGHTRQPQIQITLASNLERNPIAFIDTLETSGEYLLVEHGWMSPVQL